MHNSVFSKLIKNGPVVNNEKTVIHSLDLYTTKGGRVAFLTAEVQDPGLKDSVFHGYVLNHVRGQTVKTAMAWLKTGVCITTSDEADRIIWKA